MGLRQVRHVQALKKNHEPLFDSYNLVEKLNTLTLRNICLTVASIFWSHSWPWAEMLVKKNPILGKIFEKNLRCFFKKVSNVAILRFLVAFFVKF